MTDKSPAQMTDGFQNLVANLGTSRDKAAANGYVVDALDVQMLETAYRSAPIARKIIDMPAEDAFREWREWQADTKQISAIEAEEARLNLKGKLIKTMKSARLHGGAAVYIGTTDSDPEQPLNPKSVKRGGLKYLTVLSRYELIEGDIQRDPRLQGYGEPAFYSMSAGDAATVKIHPSRLVVFRGMEAPTTAISQDSWGDSVLTGALETIQRLDATLANVASLVFEAKIDVIKIKDFTQGLRSGGATYEQLMLRRFALASTAKGINGALLLDADEDYSQKSASFATLPDVMDRFAQMCASAAGIPVTLLFGQSPGGLNATGESDVRGYYDRIKVMQSLDVSPALSVLDECLIYSALGNRSAEIFYDWRSLWQVSAKERAEIGDKLASAFEKIHRMDVLPIEAVGKAVVNAFTEAGVAPGFEADVAEFYNPDGDDDDDTPIEPADAAPRTLYVHRKVTNGADIIAWAKEQGFKTTLPADDLHVTIAFSRQAVDWMKMGESWQAKVEVPEGGARIMEQFGDAKVLLFSSSELSWRHEEMKREGAVWGYPEYQPHISISYDTDAPDLKDIEPYTGKIDLGPEVFAEIKEDWQEGIKEA